MIRSLLCAGALLCAGPAAAQPVFHQLFGDGAVIQRDQAVPVWGRAIPGERVTVTLNGRSAAAMADAGGRWRVSLPPQKAGGPYRLTARGRDGAEALASNVLVGDVWLCSGQSNMELPVSRVTNAPAEIAGAANDRIRLLTVKQEVSVRPRADFASPVGWSAATPASVADFSAACFFMARDLQKTTGAPAGLIDASWGGSAIEPWMSAGALRTAGGYDDQLDILAEYAERPEAANARWGAVWEQWWRSRNPRATGQEPWSADAGAAAGWRAAPRTGAWELWGVSELAEFNGLMWLRTSLTLTPEQAAKRAVLALGPIDDADQTWVNGRPVGAGSGAGLDRLYPLAPGLLKPGRNEVVVSVLDTWSLGGMHAPEKQTIRFADGSSVPLNTGWRYRTEPAATGSPPRAPWDTLAGLSGMYNAMIAPIGPYALRGVAWYQGESNTGQSERYRGLLKGLMADWRRERTPALPFLVVQLANYGPPPTAPGPSGWAQLRESQRLAVADDRHAGLAVAVDIGDRYDIHPTNKQEVGRRLARAARRVVFGEAVSPSGPRPVNAVRQGGGAAIRFADVQGELVALGSNRPIAWELCGADQASCRFVDATIRGDQVLLQGDGRPASRVRFCWADSPVCNLYDRSGLPAGPFEMRLP